MSSPLLPPGPRLQVRQLLVYNKGADGARRYVIPFLMDMGSVFQER